MMEMVKAAAFEDTSPLLLSSQLPVSWGVENSARGGRGSQRFSGLLELG